MPPAYSDIFFSTIWILYQVFAWYQLRQLIFQATSLKQFYPPQLFIKHSCFNESLKQNFLGDPDFRWKLSMAIICIKFNFAHASLVLSHSRSLWSWTQSTQESLRSRVEESKCLQVSCKSVSVQCWLPVQCLLIARAQSWPKEMEPWFMPNLACQTPMSLDPTFASTELWWWLTLYQNPSHRL